MIWHLPSERVPHIPVPLAWEGSAGFWGHPCSPGLASGRVCGISAAVTPRPPPPRPLWRPCPYLSSSPTSRGPHSWQAPLLIETQVRWRSASEGASIPPPPLFSAGACGAPLSLESLGAGVGGKGQSLQTCLGRPPRGWWSRPAWPQVAGPASAPHPRPTRAPCSPAASIRWQCRSCTKVASPGGRPGRELLCLAAGRVTWTENLGAHGFPQHKQSSQCCPAPAAILCPCLHGLGGTSQRTHGVAGRGACVPWVGARGFSSHSHQVCRPLVRLPRPEVLQPDAGWAPCFLWPEVTRLPPTSGGDTGSRLKSGSPPPEGDQVRLAGNARGQQAFLTNGAVSPFFVDECAVAPGVLWYK